MLSFFNSSLGIRLGPDQIVQTIIEFMKADPKREYRITIGTDSERKSDKTADFVTAIVVHRVGNGARYFWRRIDPEEKFHTLRDRILKEVLLSLEVAKVFLETTKKFSLPKFDFAIHVDVGERGESRVMIQELVGMIRANNYEVKTKPESYAASNVADRHV